MKNSKQKFQHYAIEALLGIVGTGTAPAIVFAMYVGALGIIETLVS